MYLSIFVFLCRQQQWEFEVARSVLPSNWIGNGSLHPRAVGCDKDDENDDIYDADNDDGNVGGSYVNIPKWAWAWFLNVLGMFHQVVAKKLFFWSKYHLFSSNEYFSFWEGAWAKNPLSDIDDDEWQWLFERRIRNRFLLTPPKVTSPPLSLSQPPPAPPPLPCATYSFLLIHFIFGSAWVWNVWSQ